jgi:hypothetical protein
MERDWAAHTTALGTADAAKVGEPAGELFDEAARDNQHVYFDRSQREVGHGICRAVSGAPPPLETPDSVRWIILDF